MLSRTISRRNSKAPLSLTKDREHTILCLGDSNTFGLKPGTSERYDASVRWTSLLQKQLGRRYHIIEEGLCGRTTVYIDPYRQSRRMIDVLPVLLESHQPLDGIVLMLGTNDCKTIFHNEARNISKGMDYILQLIHRRMPDVPLLLISPIHLGDNVGLVDQDFNEHSVEVSKSLASFYETLALKYDYDFLDASHIAKAAHEDEQHLNKEGHQAFADALTSYFLQKDDSYESS